MTSEQQEPDRGSETRVMCLLHEFGAMDEEAIAYALDLMDTTVTRCLGLLLARAFIRTVAFRGKVCYESTGRWWPGLPSETTPTARDEHGRFAYAPPEVLPPPRWNANGRTMSPVEEAAWSYSFGRQQ